MQQRVETINELVLLDTVVVCKVIAIDEVVHARVGIHDDIDAVKEQVKLPMKNAEELVHHVHVQEALALIVLCEQLRLELLLRIEHHGVFAPHQTVRNGTSDWGSEPVAESIDFIDSLLVRQVCLDQ